METYSEVTVSATIWVLLLFSCKGEKTFFIYWCPVLKPESLQYIVEGNASLLHVCSTTTSILLGTRTINAMSYCLIRSSPFLLKQG